MYSIQGLETVFDVMAYTTSVLKEVGYSESEIEDYVSTALNEDYNLGVIEVSKEWLDECNKICADMKSDKEDDTWRDHYYSQFWDDDGERYSNIDDEEDTYDYLTKSHRKKEIWEYDNAVDDVESDEEAYEGFSSCKNYYWDSSKANNEEDDYLDGYTIKDYYDSMRSEYDVEPSYDPFNGDEED